MSSSKYNKVTSKENHENNNLKKHCSKFTSETLKNVRLQHMSKIQKHSIYTKT